MEIPELADRVFAVVGPAIGTSGSAASTREAQRAAAKQVELGRALLQEIYWRDKSVPPLETAVNDYVAGRKNQDAASTLRLRIKKVLESDAALADEVARMLRVRSGGDAAEVDAESDTETVELYKG
ncbi:MAG: hypothetical protein HOV87_22465 [Catenulispora sp.]|nr:hypothetical protein [Catenulispora sp.]